jgi:hypothetical protein
VLRMLTDSIDPLFTTEYSMTFEVHLILPELEVEVQACIPCGIPSLALVAFVWKGV